MIKSNYIVFDCETGGLSCEENPITQYAAVILDGKTLKEIDRFETFVKPYHNLIISEESLKRTMVSVSDINSGLNIKEFTDTIVKFWESHRIKSKTKEMGRLVPVGHNVTFDIAFINKALSLTNKPNITEWMYPNFIDTFPLAKLAFGITGVEKINLGACCEKINISITDAHGAMNDVEATANLLRWYMKKLRGKNSSKEETNIERAKGIEFFEFKCNNI